MRGDLREAGRHAGRFPATHEFSPDAQELFYDWLTALEAKVRANDLHPALISHLAKYRSLMPTLALLFELTAWATGSSDLGAVSLEHARLAAAWCDYLESHARRVYSCVVTPQIHAARALGEKIKAGKLGMSFSCRQVYLKGWTGLDTAEVVRAAAEVLEDAGWVRAQRTQAKSIGGRPSDAYDVNPAVWR